MITSKTNVVESALGDIQGTFSSQKIVSLA